MNRSTYPLKLPASVKRAAQRLAKGDGVSLNQWIAVAVAQKIGVVETAEDFFARAKPGGDPAHLAKFLRRAPDRAPATEDALPAVRRKRR